ncbi:MAG: hypothetical protein H7644_05075, partial [Candidatus Heimdallarchaeota archaeon]|nr:hypothetical protein [Candidatus Heimdallarchaeota archaeon]MCK5143117.1 hypothetical protein [Candidatus Heimdallarchaeota archaeon]
QYFVPSAGQVIAEATGVDLFLLILGPTPNPIGLWVILPIISIVIVGSEILERIIRARYIQNRMPRFLSGAEWMVAEPPVALDIVSSSNNLIWLMYVILIIIFAPLSFHEEIYAKFLEVYQVESAALRSTTLFISILDVALVSGIMFAILYQNYEKFRGSLDRQQLRQDIKFESQTRQMFQIAIGATMFATLMLVGYYFTFWSGITVTQVLIFYAVTIISSVLGVWLFWQKEGYVFITMAIWFFLSAVVMIFMNANNPSYSWMIICNLFLIILVVVLSLNRYFSKNLEKKGIHEPSWMYNLFPLFAFISVLIKKKVRISRGVDKELDEILEEEMKDRVKEKEPLVIDMGKVKKKGKESIKIIQTYQKILSRIVKGEVNIVSLVGLNNLVLDIIKEDKKLHKEAIQVFKVVDSLLWDDNYVLKQGETILTSAANIYEELVKQR